MPRSYRKDVRPTLIGTAITVVVDYLSTQDTRSAVRLFDAPRPFQRVQQFSELSELLRVSLPDGDAACSVIGAWLHLTTDQRLALADAADKSETENRRALRQQRKSGAIAAPPVAGHLRLVTAAGGAR